MTDVYGTQESVAVELSRDDLTKIKGIGSTTAEKSFFLRKKELNDPEILKIIENNLNNKNFDPNYLKEVHNILINHKPNKHSFHYYCNTIAALQKQYFTITSIRPADFKKLNIDQLFKLFIVIYRKNPEIREYPSNLFQFFIGNKRNMTNQAILQNYLEIIKISENFREFCDFCKQKIIPFRMIIEILKNYSAILKKRKK